MKPSLPNPRLSEPRIALAELTQDFRKTLDELEDYLSGARGARKDWPKPVRIVRPR